MYGHQTRQGADLVSEAPKHDPLIKWQKWGHWSRDHLENLYLHFHKVYSQ